MPAIPTEITAEIDRRVMDIASDIQDGQTRLLSCIPIEGHRDYMHFLLTVSNVPQYEKAE